MAFEQFLSPGRIGTLELKNRSIFPPMGTAFASNDGFITDRTINYHKRRVEGGCAMNIVEIASVHITSYNPHTPGIWDDKFIPGLTKLASSIKDAGGIACIQLWHGGRQTSGKPYGGKPWAPSAIPCPLIQEEPHEMSIDEIKEVVSAYGDAALRAKQAGFDAVELHGAHGYLIDGFLNAYSNTRTDEYGGNIENRMRFALEIIADIKEKCGEDYPLLFRMVAKENVDNGVTIEDAIVHAKRFEEAGVHALDISQGCYTVMNWTVPPYFYDYKTNAKNAATIKEHVNIPVIVAGRITTPEMAEEVLRDGQADFISLGRIQIADPDFVKKAIENRSDEIVHCISCNSGCVEHMFAGGGASCIFNPQAGKEEEYKIVDTDEPKKILVIGGGLAGLEAARVAASRGHEVVLFEGSSRLGGQFLIAGKAPHKDVFSNAAVELSVRAMKAGVDIRLHTKATIERIKDLNPDHIVVATGSNAFIPSLPTSPEMDVHEAREVLDGKDFVKGEKVLVIGGGLTGLEVAEVLTEQGKEVTVIDMLDEIGKDLEMYIRPYMMNYLEVNKIPTHPNTKAVKIAANRVLAEQNGVKVEFNCDAVVWAAGSKADLSVQTMLDEAELSYTVIGDAKKPDKAIHALWAGNEIGRTI